MMPDAVPSLPEISPNAKTGVLTLAGYGIRIAIERGHLCLEDGIGAKRRHGRFARVPRSVKRVVVLGHSGVISFEALRWIQDVGAAFVQIDGDGKLIIASGPSGLNDARLRRAQALASTNGLGLEIARELLREKLQAQAKNLRVLSATDQAAQEIKKCIAELSHDMLSEDLRGTEARAAIAYWGAWHDTPVQFEHRDAERVPDHWRTFGQRHSLLSKPSPRRAINPANAILNYLYAILEAEARIAALRMGLDPGLGLLHADQRARDSLPCDLMEPVRPKVDAFVFELLARREFRKADLFETREGICRLMPPLTRTLAETGPVWAKELAPVTERVARTLFQSVRESRESNEISRSNPATGNRLPTPLTESNRSAGRATYRRRPEPKTVEEMKAWLFG